MSTCAVLEQIIATLEAELMTLTRAARDSYAAATDPDSRAENKYDTRTLEASYVARGQAQRVAEVTEAVEMFKGLRAVSVASHVVAVGSLVALKAPGETMHCFLGPAAGGTQVEHQGVTVDVVTPTSPLGQKLLGSKNGTTIQLSPTFSAVVEISEA